MTTSEEHLVTFDSFWAEFGQYTYYVRDCELNELPVEDARILRLSRENGQMIVVISNEAEIEVCRQEFSEKDVKIEVSEGVFVFEEKGDKFTRTMIINYSGEMSD